MERSGRLIGFGFFSEELEIIGHDAILTEPVVNGHLIRNEK